MTAHFPVFGQAIQFKNVARLSYFYGPKPHHLVKYIIDIKAEHFRGQKHLMILTCLLLFHGTCSSTERNDLTLFYVILHE